MVNFLLGAKMNTETIVMLVLLAIMVVVLIVLPMFTNKRRNKAINDLHASLHPGDIVKTVGGIVGKVVEIKEISPVDKEMVIETGIGDTKSTMVFDIQAVYQILSKAEVPQQAQTAPFEEVPAQETVEKKEEAQAVAPETEEAVVPAAEDTTASVTEENATENETVATTPKKPRRSTKK